MYFVQILHGIILGPTVSYYYVISISRRITVKSLNVASTGYITYLNSSNSKINLSDNGR